MSIQIFIIDEHKPARDSLSQRLETLADMVVVGSTGNGEEGLRQIEELLPDVVLLDTKMRKADGMDVCRRACSTNGGAKVAVLTSYHDPEERRFASEAGVNGYFLKDVDTAMLAQWIRHLATANSAKPT